MKGLFVAASVISAVVGFVKSSLSGHEKFGNVYMGVIYKSWGQVFVVFTPLVLYTVVSVSSSGWSKIFQSPELAMGAFLLLLAANHSLGTSLSLRRDYPVVPARVSLISAWSLGWLCASLVTVVLVFQESEIPIVVIFWQGFLVAISVITYFATAAMVRLIDIGYSPRGARGD